MTEKDLKQFYGIFLNQANFLYKFLHVNLILYEKYNYR